MSIIPLKRCLQKDRESRTSTSNDDELILWSSTTTVSDWTKSEAIGFMLWKQARQTVILEKREVDKMSPMFAGSYLVTISQLQGIPSKGMTFPELKSQKAVFGATDAARICRPGYGSSTAGGGRRQQSMWEFLLILLLRKAGLQAVCIQNETPWGSAETTSWGWELNRGSKVCSILEHAVQTQSECTSSISELFSWDSPKAML